MSTSTNPPSNTKHRSRLDRIASLTVQELLEFSDQKELSVSSLMLTVTPGLQAEACLLLLKAYSSEGQTVYNLASELILQRIKDEKRSSDQPDSTPSPGMA